MSRFTRESLARELRSRAHEDGWMGEDDATALMGIAADLLDPPDDQNTVDVRILVRVDIDEDGPVYEAAGWLDADPGELRDRLNEEMACRGIDNAPHRHAWVTARVPKPEPVAEVEGTVES